MDPNKFADALRQMIRDEVRTGVQEAMKEERQRQEQEANLQKSARDAVNSALYGAGTEDDCWI